MKLLSIFLYIMLMTRAYGASGFNIIVNNDQNIVVESLTKEQVKSLFLGYQLYLKGKRVKLAHLSLKTEAMTQFTEDVLGMSPREYSAYWRRKLFSGKGIPPREFDDPEELINYVEKNENAIAILGAVSDLKPSILVIPATSLAILKFHSAQIVLN